MIQNKDSPDFLHFLRGFFHRNNIYQILSNSTFKEHREIYDIYNCSKDDRPLKIQLCLESRYSKDQVQKFLPTAIRRINEDIGIIGEALKKVIPKDECDWLWPKGGINKDEKPIDCAIRETSEEAGVDIPYESIIDSEPLSFEITTFFGSTFRTCYYIANLDFEIPPGEIDTSEVSKAEWVPISEARQRMNPLAAGSLIDKVLAYFN